MIGYKKGILKRQSFLEGNIGRVVHIFKKTQQLQIVKQFQNNVSQSEIAKTMNI